jgi:carboxyl-terminal processing protease
MKNKFKIGLITFSTALSIVLLIGAVLGQDRESKEPYRPLAVMSEVLSRIQTDYVEEPNFDRVTDGALQGMVESLDPYNSYLTPELYKEYKKGWRGEASIGAVISKKFGLPGVVSVTPGGPAEKAGLMPGDLLEAISGRSSREMSYEEVLARLEGPIGSKVTVSVVRQRSQEPKSIELIREKVSDPPVETKLMDGHIGYLKVRALPTGISRELATRIVGLRRSGAQKFVLDLRDAASGDMQEGPAVANLFIADGLLGYVEGQQYPRQNFLADKTKAVASEPATVLVNETTGGPAEIVAGAFLDTHRGDVVGARTFGIGSVQKLIPLPDGAAVILSVAKFHAPAGKAIQDSGVTPNEVVEQPRDFVALNPDDSGEYVEPTPASKGPKEDLQLKRAIELLQEGKQEMPKAA